MSRKPRDLAAYKPAAESAAWLRHMADQVEQGATAYPFVKLVLQWWNWNPDWEKKKKKKKESI